MTERRISAGGRPRPVADIPEAVLADRAGVAAKAWLVALLERRPLSEAGRVPAALLAERGPALCEAVLRALASDVALEELGAERAAEVAELAGAVDATEVVVAVETLRAALWAAVADALPPGSSAVAGAELSDRLAHACSIVTVTALASAGAAGGFDQRGIDDRPHAAMETELDEPIRAFRKPAPSPEAPLWVSALRRELAEGARAGRRFGLLLAELDDADRLRLSERDEIAAGAFDSAGRAVRRQVRRADVLAHEEDRFWLIAPDAGRAGSLALAGRVAGAVKRAASLRGAPLTVSVGAAIFPEDGIDAETLIDRAEQYMFAARAAGVQLGDEDDEPASSRFGRGPRIVS
jgi:GGDEF domain-containing protein